MTRSPSRLRAWSIVLLPGLLTILALGCARKNTKGRGQPRRSATATTGRFHEAKRPTNAQTARNQSAPQRPGSQRGSNGAQKPADTTGTVRRAVYRLTLMDKEVGRLVQEEQVLSDRIRTEEQAEISLRRGAASIHMKIRSRTEERLDSTPISFSVLIDQGTVKIRSEGHYQNGKMVVKDQSGTRQIPYDRQWLFPAAAERKILAAGFSKGTKLEFFQFDPLMGMTGKKVTVEVLGDAQVQWNGKQVTCHRVRMTVGNLSPTTACVDDANLAYESTLSFGAVSLHITLLSKTLRGRVPKSVGSKTGMHPGLSSRKGPLQRGK